TWVSVRCTSRSMPPHLRSGSPATGPELLGTGRARRPDLANVAPGLVPAAHPTRAPRSRVVSRPSPPGSSPVAGQPVNRSIAIWTVAVAIALGSPRRLIVWPVNTLVVEV